LFDISDILSNIIEKAEQRKLDELLSKDTFTMYDFAKLFTIAGPEILKIISLTTNTPEAKLRSLSMQDGVKIAFAIYKQNRDTIKNAFAPLLLGVRLVEGEETDDEKEEN